MELGPEDAKALIIGLVGGVIVLAGHGYYKKFERSNILSDIEILTYEKEHLEGMKRSSVEMNRVSFRAIFALLMIFSFAEGVPHFVRLVESAGSAYYSLVSLFVWATAGGISYKYFKRLNDLKSMKSALERIDGKIEKLNSKL
ncbi:hypothetical protein [Neptunomonas antarctica]|uniref:Uncharacterized protein n=1 Tax=Neptunomonas antarctica TaxID=619304 RepID=A0A1N7MQR8_9GAMM|nr:hypothetical protein [Neptunomonas antarctica]SIS88400.1 hypothetical protein SAMN05421760_106274 [Neptunomonas antarctica]